MKLNQKLRIIVFYIKAIDLNSNKVENELISHPVFDYMAVVWCLNWNEISFLIIKILKESDIYLK